jgi:hypothetical protein
MYKVGFSLVVAILATVVAAKLAFESTVNPDIEPVNRPWAHNTMQFVSWNHEKWSRHTNPSLAFIDWNGEAWQAKISGDNFILAQRGDWQGATERVEAIRYRDWQGNNKLRTTLQLRR